MKQHLKLTGKRLAGSELGGSYTSALLNYELVDLVRLTFAGKSVYCSFKPSCKVLFVCVGVKL